MENQNKDRRGTTYTKFIGILAHLIDRKPQAIKHLLEEYGVGFEDTSTKKGLINATVDLLASDNKNFESDLGELVKIHISSDGSALVAFEEEDEDTFLKGLVGGLAKGLVGGIGGLFKKKRRRRRGGAAAAAATANNVKNDMAQQMQRMQQEAAERRRKEEAERRRREEERREQERKEKREREEREAREKKEAAARSRRTTMMIVGVVGVLVVGGVIVMMTKSSGAKALAAAK